MKALSKEEVIHTTLLGLARRIGPGSEAQVADLTHTGASLLRPFSKYLYRLEIDPTEIIEKMFSMLGKLLQRMTLADKYLLIEAKLLPPSK